MEDAVMEDQDKRSRGSMGGERKWFGSGLNLPYIQYYLTQALKILALMLLFHVSFGLVALDEQVQEGVPPAAVCLLSKPAKGTFDRLKAPQEEKLAREMSTTSSDSSVVLKHMLAGADSNPQQLPVARQLPFESVCDGWCNVFRKNLKHLQTGYWSYDAERGALVAKHIYQNAQEVAAAINPRSARLLSPVFEAPPAYHSWPDSPLRGTCRLSFRYYHTGSSLQFDVHLFRPKTRQAARQPIPSACDSRQKLLLSRQTWSDDETIFQRAKGVDAASLLSRHHQSNTNQARLEAEESVWQTVVLTLPEALNSSYAIEFFTFGAQLEADIDKPIANNYLHGVALSNITLSPECFGLNVNTTEAERVRVLAEAKSYAEFGLLERFKEHLSEFWHHHWLYVVLFISLLLCLILSILLYLCYTYAEALKTATSIKIQANGEIGERRRCLYGWLHWPPTGRSRVYAGGGGAGRLRQHQHQMQLKSQQENLRQFLQPLRVPLEGVEMAENPGYLGKSLANKQPAIYQNTTAAVNGTHATSDGGSPPTNGTGRGLELAMQQNDVELACDRILQPYYIDRSRLSITKELGNGAFGRVYQGCLVCYCDKTNDGASVEANNTTDTCCDETHSIKVAVKTLTDLRMGRREFVQEAANMALVSHRNIVELLGVCFEGQTMFIVMELLTGGNLKDFLIKNRNHGQSLWRWSSVLSLAGGSPHQQQDNYCLLQSAGGQPSPLVESPAPPTQQLCMGDLLVFGLDVARACDYLQRRNFIHRDLAARNCLVSAAHKALSMGQHQQWMAGSSGSLDAAQHQHHQHHRRPRSAQGAGPPSALEVGANHKVDLDEVFLNGFQNSQLVVKLADFGMTRDIYGHHYYRLGRREMPVRWMPPECLDGIATSKSDVWSFGVLLWELFSMGQQPYQDLANHQVIELLKTRRHTRRPPSTSAASNYDQPLLVLDQADRAPEVARSCEKQQPPEQLQLEPPLPPPHDNTPHPVYSIMCACWAANQDDRPQFDELANRLYWCTQMPQVLNTPLPQFLGPPTSNRPGAGSSQNQNAYTPGTVTGESGRASGATTQLTQLNWGPA